MPIMCALFVLLFLDRTNVGNARVAGLQSDLRLTDRRYQTRCVLFTRYLSQSI
jgi:hypothetical protein